MQKRFYYLGKCLNEKMIYIYILKLVYKDILYTIL